MKNPKYNFPPEQRNRKYHPLNMQTVKSFHWQYCSGDFEGLEGYMRANADVSAELVRLVNKADNFKELKNQILAFAQDRRNFNKDVQKNIFDILAQPEVVASSSSKPDDGIKLE